LYPHYGIHRFVSHDVFMSHSVKDPEISDRIHMYLESKGITHLLRGR
jgi:hypothetical protein